MAAQLLKDTDIRAATAYSDAVGDAFFAVDFEWRFIAVSEAVAQFVGFKPEEILGRTYWEVVPQAAGTEDEMMLRAAMAARARVKFDAPSTLRPDRTLEGVAFPIEGGTAFSFRDTTGVRQQEGSSAIALRESEARFRHMADSAPALIWMTDQRGRVSFLNMHFKLMFGRPVDEMLGHGWSDLLVREDVPVFRNAFLAAFSTRQPFRTEVRAINRGGEIVWLRCESVPRLDDAGRFLGYTGCAIDVTDTRSAQQAYHKSEKRLRAVHEHAGVGIAETDREARYLDANEAFCRITDYPKSMLVGHVCWGLTHESFREIERARYDLLVAGILDTYTIEKQFRRKGGELRWAWLACTAVRDERGDFISAVRTLIDVTDDKRAEERLQLLVHELNHRVKNTLATVQSIVSQSLRASSSSTEARDAVVDRLVALSRVHDSLTQENWEAAKLRKTVFRALEPFNASKRIDISGPKVLVPPRVALAIAMTLHELATNATKYGALSNEHGKVELSWTLQDIGEQLGLTMRWQERGGPPVSPPTRTGFGSRLIRRSLAQELRSEVQLLFEPSGVVCSMNLVLPTTTKTNGTGEQDG